MPRNGLGAVAVSVLASAPVFAQDVDGAAVFETACSACHGDESELNAAAMAGLDQAGFTEAVSSHPPVSDVVAGLSEAEIAALHEYVSGQGGG